TLEVRTLEAHVDVPCVAGVRVVEEDRMRITGDVAGLPQEGEVDDRELEALVAVDRQDLDRVSVGLEPATAVPHCSCPRRLQRCAAVATWSARSLPSARRLPPRAGAAQRGAGL